MQISMIIAMSCLALAVSGKVYFKEEFNSDTIPENWVQSKHKSDYGKLVISAGKYHADAQADRGLKTSEDAKFYDISAKFAESFSNEGKTLVVQFQIKHEQGIDCGGGYIKLLAADFEPTAFHGDTAYNIMFGPDICGSTKKVHVIFAYKGTNHLIKKEIQPKEDELSHLYTLVVRPDNTYEVLIDNEKTESGKLDEDWDMLKPKKIKDPAAKKPADWVDTEKIDDPKDTKPADWDKPKSIPDPKAKKPADWDDEMDGEWEAPKIDNPEYKGEWKPKQIDNPAYKGPWVHPEIDNPEFVADDKLYAYKSFGGVGIDLWQVKSGTIFDNIWIGDSVEEAKAFGESTWKKLSEVEKKKKDAADEEERKKTEEEEKKRKEEEDKKKKEGGADKKDDAADDKKDEAGSGDDATDKKSEVPKEKEEL